MLLRGSEGQGPRPGDLCSGGGKPASHDDGQMRITWCNDLVSHASSEIPILISYSCFTPNQYAAKEGRVSGLLLLLLLLGAQLGNAIRRSGNLR